MAYEDIKAKVTDLFSGNPEKRKEKRTMDALANVVMKRYEEAKNAKQEVKEKWIQHIKLWRGDHWEGRKSSWKSQATHNIAYSVVETMLPLMFDRQPEILYLPQTEQDQKHAKSLNQASSFVWNKDNMNEKMPETLRDLLIIGTGILKMRWDDEQYQGMGEITADKIDPFSFFPAPESTDPYYDMDWCIFRTKLHIRKIKQKWGMEVPSDYDYCQDDHSRPTDTQSGMNAKLSQNHATVLEYWYHDEEGNIRVALVSNGVLLEDKENPYEHNQFPFVFFYNHKLNGEFWGFGEFENLKGLQMELNKTRSLIQDNMIAMNNSIILIDSNSGVRPSDLSNKPAQVVQKTPGSKIERMPPPPIPNYFFENVSLTKEAMEDVSGVRDISRGVTSQTAAQGIQMLIEQSQTRIRSKLRNVENAVKRMAYWYLVFFRSYYAEPRILRLTDEDGFKFETFDARNLRQSSPKIDPQTGQPIPVLDEQGQPVIDQMTGQPQVEMEELVSEFDIVISSGSSMMMNKAAKFEQAFQLYQAQAIDIVTLLNYAEVGDVKEITGRMTQYGMLPDPNAPKVNLAKALGDLGFKFNMTSNEPQAILDALNQVQEQIAQIEGETGQLAGDMGDKQQFLNKIQNDLVKQANEGMNPLNGTEPPLNQEL